MQTLTFIELLYILKYMCTLNNFYNPAKSTKTWFSGKFKITRSAIKEKIEVCFLHEMVDVVHLTWTVSWTIQGCATF